MKCVFFVSEETGCTGSSRARMELFDDCRYVLQCDRRGNSDMVVRYGDMELCSAEFLHDADPLRFGYHTSAGLITDVITLKMRRPEISCVNLSCGYYLPHTPHEFTCTEDLEKCCRFVRHIVENCNKTCRHDIRKTERYGYGRMTAGFSEYEDVQNRMPVKFITLPTGRIRNAAGSFTHLFIRKNGLCRFAGSYESDFLFEWLAETVTADNLIDAERHKLLDQMESYTNGEIASVLNGLHDHTPVTDMA